MKITTKHISNRPVTFVKHKPFASLLFGTGHYLSPGVGRRIWDLKRWNSADAPFQCYFAEVIPLITFDDFRDPPPPPYVFIFQANLSGPPLYPSKVFSDLPFWVLSYECSSLLFSQKSIYPPTCPRQAINNDRSLTVSQREAMMMAASFEAGQFSVICCHFCVSK